MILYKLTDQRGFTHGGTYNYLRDSTHTKKPVRNPRLCSEDVYHSYIDADLGLLLNPTHGDFYNPRLFKIEGDVAVNEEGKVGSFSQTILEELPLPDWYVDRRAEVCSKFANLCADAVIDGNNHLSNNYVLIVGRHARTAKDAAYKGNTYLAARTAAYAATHAILDTNIDIVSLAKQAVS